MTLISREPRQIVGFDVAEDKSPERLQSIVDSVPEAKNNSKRQIPLPLYRRKGI